MKTIWTESYRPKKIEDYVFRDNQQKKQVKSWIDNQAIPHLLFSGAPGVGKTSLARMLLHELKVDWGDVLEINASRERGIDIIRDKITNFSSTLPFGDFKYIILDECLDEDTLVLIKRNDIEQSIQIKNLNTELDLVKTYNIKKQIVEWKSFDLINKGYQETIEIELETGDIIICTPDHKWYVEDNNQIKVVKAKYLYKYNHILSPKEK